jgi:hypothetical protein
MAQVMATAKDTRVRVRDRKEYLKEWRKKNAEHIKKYREDKYPDYAQHVAEAKIKNPERYIHSRAKRRAKNKNFKFNIEISDINIPNMCPILDIPIFKVRTQGKKAGPTSNSASLDRIDNTKGYIKGNIQVVSHQANTMKGNATPEELIKFAKWILKTYEPLL